MSVTELVQMLEARFFVQEYDRGVWHVESADDPELMLCGIVIPVDSETAKVQTRWGIKRCLWCEHALSPGGDNVVQST